MKNIIHNFKSCIYLKILIIKITTFIQTTKDGVGVVLVSFWLFTCIFLFQSLGSVSDLIKLDDSPTDLEDFDPLKCRDKNNVEQIKSSTDSALLHEYGLDFSQFGLLDYTPSSSSNHQEASSSVPKGWTTFN